MHSSSQVAECASVHVMYISLYSGVASARAKHGCCRAPTRSSWLVQQLCATRLLSPYTVCMSRVPEDVRYQVEGMFRSTLADPNGLLVRESSLSMWRCGLCMPSSFCPQKKPMASAEPALPMCFAPRLRGVSYFDWRHPRGGERAAHRVCMRRST